MAVRSDPSLSSQIRAYNQEALKQLRCNRIDEALTHLQRAGKLLHKIEDPEKSTFARTLTCKSARNALKRDTFEAGSSHQRYRFDKKPERDAGLAKVKLAKSHLTECTARSKQGDHISALHHAQEALKCLSSERLSASVNVFIALAHYSEGVEWEYLKEKQGAREAYMRAVEVARRELGEGHELTQSLMNFYKKVADKGGKFTNSDRSEGLDRTFSPTKVKHLLLQTAKKHSSKTQIKRNFVYIPVLSSRRKLAKSGAMTTRTRSAPKGKSFPFTSQSPLNSSKVLHSTPKTSSNFYETLRKSLKIPLHEEMLSPIYSIKTAVQRVKTEASVSPSIEQQARGAISELERLKKLVSDEHRLHVPAQVRVPKLPKRRLFTANAHPLSPIPESASRTKLAPVVQIQAAVRGFLSRKRYQKLRSAALVLQTRIRGYQVLSLYRNIRSAIIHIQRYWRKHHPSHLGAPH
jgi:hypothetical protein